MLTPPETSEALALALLESATRSAIACARAYAAITHGNLSGEAYLRREEAREQLRDALATLDRLEERVAA